MCRFQLRSAIAFDRNAAITGERLNTMVAISVALALLPANIEWSKSVAGLAGRISAVQQGKKGDSPKIVTYLTLRNVTDSYGTVDVYLSSNNLKLWLEKKDGQRIEPEPSGGANGRNGFIPSPFWLMLPIDSQIRMRMDLSGYFDFGASEFVIEAENDYLRVPKGWKHATYLCGEFSVVDPPHEPRGMRFEGKLHLPRILIFDGKRIVSEEPIQSR